MLGGAEPPRRIRQHILGRWGCRFFRRGTNTIEYAIRRRKDFSCRVVVDGALTVIGEFCGDQIIGASTAVIPAAFVEQGDVGTLIRIEFQFDFHFPMFRSKLDNVTVTMAFSRVRMNHKLGRSHLIFRRPL